MMGLELIGGLIYLLLGGDLLVRGATALARRMQQQLGMLPAPSD